MTPDPSPWREESPSLTTPKRIHRDPRGWLVRRSLTFRVWKPRDAWVREAASVLHRWSLVPSSVPAFLSAPGGGESAGPAGRDDPRPPAPLAAAILSGSRSSLPDTGGNEVQGRGAGGLASLEVSVSGLRKSRGLPSVAASLRRNAWSLPPLQRTPVPWVSPPHCGLTATLFCKGPPPKCRCWGNNK